MAPIFILKGFENGQIIHYKYIQIHTYIDTNVYIISLKLGIRNINSKGVTNSLRSV